MAVEELDYYNESLQCQSDARSARRVQIGLSFILFFQLLPLLLTSRVSKMIGSSIFSNK